MVYRGPFDRTSSLPSGSSFREPVVASLRLVSSSLELGYDGDVVFVFLSMIRLR